MNDADLEAKLRPFPRYNGALGRYEALCYFDDAVGAVAAAVDAERANTATMQDLVKRSVRLLRHVYGSKRGFACVANEYVEAAELALRVAASTTPTDPERAT